MIEPSDEERQALESGKTILAIKLLRDRTGMNLRDCLTTVRAWNGACPHGYKLDRDGDAPGCREGCNG